MINIFRGICFCANCGHTMSILSHAHNGASYRYLRCSVGGIGGKNACGQSKSLRLDEMEMDFFTHFLSRHPYEMINVDDKEELRRIKVEIDAKQVHLSQLNDSFNDGVALLGVIKAKELQDKLASIETERSKVKAELDSLNLKVSMVENAPSDFDALAFFTKALRSEGTVFPKDWTRDDQYRHTIKDVLWTNENREKLRLLLPSLLGKITVDASKRQFYIYNRLGKLIFESTPQASHQNCTDRWKASLKQWNTRKVGDRVITVRRKA
jgi:hypothetical protein